MAIVDRVKWDGANTALAWKFPSEELSTWTQLIVNESQEAYLVRGGVYEGPFRSGRHVLSTENIPLLRAFLGIPFGGKSPFSAEVWFVNLATNLNVPWGTPDPIQILDPTYKLMVPVRAFGQYGIRISESKVFLNTLVGTLKHFGADELAEYFRGEFITRLKTEIAKAIVKEGIPVLELSAHLDVISETVRTALATFAHAYGVTLERFNINSINVPENDSAVMALKAALAKRAEMSVLGFTYQQERSFDVLEGVAKNEGTAASISGAALGIGVGAGLGGPIGVAMGQAAAQALPSASPGDAMSSHEVRIKMIKELHDLLSTGVLTEAEFAAEKARVLATK
jgi:membrane protease subunit (stomatin/prohibitin family)